MRNKANVADQGRNGESVSQQEQLRESNATHDEPAPESEEDWVLVDSARNPATLSASTFGTMGKGERILELGKEAVLFDYTSPDNNQWRCMNHFWFGGNFPGVASTRIRYYVDGESTPSIDMELYMGHGIGFQSNDNSPWITKYMGKVGRKNGIHNNYRIPFQRSIRVTAQRANGGDEQQETPQSWWILRGTLLKGLPLGSTIPANPIGAKLCLAKLEGYLAQPLEEFDILNLPSGKGALFQVCIAAQSTSFTFLEACMRAYLQSASDEPLMLSSGLEDYFLGTYYFDTGLYQSDLAGLTHLDKKLHRLSAYRFHGDRDPVLFDNGLRLTCRCGETEHGHKDGPSYQRPQPTTYTTYVWYYQWL